MSTNNFGNKFLNTIQLVCERPSIEDYNDWDQDEGILWALGCSSKK